MYHCKKIERPTINDYVERDVYLWRMPGDLDMKKMDGDIKKSDVTVTMSLGKKYLKKLFLSYSSGNEKMALKTKSIQ